MCSKIAVTLTGIPLKAYDYVANGKPALNERT
jgi:predicted helicase